MRKLAVAAAILAGTAILGTIPVTASAATSVNWRARTCAAATAYQRHPSRAGLERLVTDSFRVAPKYLGADVGQLYADVEGGGVKYVAKDERWIAEDCN